MAFFLNFKKSFNELKSVRCLTVTALLIAVSVALKFATILPSETLKISFAFVGLAAIGMLFGPTVAGLAGIVTDVVGFLVRPTGAFSPIFTLVEVIGAVIYGIFLYNLNPAKIEFEKGRLIHSIKVNLVQVVRVFMAKFSVNLICNVILNTGAMVMMGFFAPELFWIKICERALKNLMMLPIEVAILLVILYPVMVAYRAAFKVKTA